MESQVNATFDQDSKRYHRFSIDDGQEITGMIYIPKGSEIPEKVVVQLKTKREKRSESEGKEE